MKILAFILLGIVLFLSTLYFFKSPVIYHGSAKHDFLLDKNYTSVRRKLQQEGTMEQIIEIHYGKLISHKWLNKEFILVRLRRPTQWTYRAYGIAEIKIYDKYVGEQILIFNQDVYADQDKLINKLTLKEPAEGINFYETTTRFEAEGNKTRVYASTRIEIPRKAPAFLRNYVQSKVDKSATTSVRRSEKAIKTVLLLNKL